MSNKVTIELTEGLFAKPELTITDGYHSFEELYDHRIALFLALCGALDNADVIWKEEPDFGDWVCVYLELETGQISYHLPGKYRSILESRGYLKAESSEQLWDGHTSAKVVERLLEFAK